MSFTTDHILLNGNEVADERIEGVRLLARYRCNIFQGKARMFSPCDGAREA